MVGDLIARLVSHVFNPVVIPIATTAVVMALLGGDQDDMVAAFLFIGLAFSIIPALDVLWMVSRGFASSVELADPNERREPLSLAIGLGLLGLLFYSLLDNAIDLVSILALTYIGNLAVVLVITLFWKISIHATGVAGMLAVTLYFIGPFFRLTIPFEGMLIAVLVLAVPLVMWARVRLDAHTPAQVIVGALLGFVGHWAGFYYGSRIIF